MTKIPQQIYSQSVLPFGKAMIRVIDLNPGDEDDEIEGTLRVLQLDTNPPPLYTCISYVWGDPKNKTAIMVNKQPFDITINLYDVLRHVRSKTKTTTTWADAICINQLDIDERSRQVALMTKVYRQCLKVYIWLGAPKPGSLTANPFNFLDHWVQGKHFYDLPGFTCDSSDGSLAWTMTETCANMMNDFLQIVRSPWWTRAWTAQEGILPKDAVLMFGNWTTDWDYVLKAIDMKNSHGNGSSDCCKEAIKAFNPYQRFLIEEWMWYPGWAAKFRDILHGKCQPLMFFQALLAFTSRQCTNRRDKIYSMLSLATHSIYMDLQPNYREDVPTVYFNVFIRMLQEANGSFICFMGGGFGSLMPNLPSWVRDFSQEREAGVVAGEDKRINFITLYQASLAPPFTALWDGDRQLHYRGTYADTVKEIGVCLSTSNSGFGVVFREWFDLCKEVLGACKNTVLCNTFFRIICGDVCKTVDGGPRFRRARNSDFPKEQVLNQLMNGNVNALDMRTYGGGVNFAIWGRCFYTTYSGRMGLCQSNVIPGDEIWIMRNFHVPFVLRPLKSCDAGCAGKYSLRGDCFLDGIMDGELRERERLMEQDLLII